MSPLSYSAKTSHLVPPSPEERRAILARPPTFSTYRDYLGCYRELFERIEQRPQPSIERPVPDAATVVFWNAERGKFPAESAARLGALGGDALLICELDIGMARSNQRHTARDLAERLGCGYAFAVEFIELGLGDRAEQVQHQGAVNEAGLHGAAILSPHGLVEPVLVRLESEGAWFDGSRGERRVGGRIALLATLPLSNGHVTLANIHLESHSDPEQRAAQVSLLLDAIDLHAEGGPVLIGGDFNTSTISRDWARGTGVKPVLPLERVLDPVPFEPLFPVMADAGYAWVDCNTLGVATQRTRPDGTPRPPLGKIDWFFSRGLEASAAATVPAVDGNGQAISDHEMLAVTVQPWQLRW